MDQRCDEEGGVRDESTQHQRLDRDAEGKAHTAAKWQPDTVRVRGRPRTRWHDVINAYLTTATGDQHKQDDWVQKLADADFAKAHRDAFAGASAAADERT